MSYEIHCVICSVCVKSEGRKKYIDDITWVIWAYNRNPALGTQGEAVIERGV